MYKEIGKALVNMDIGDGSDEPPEIPIPEKKKEGELMDGKYNVTILGSREDELCKLEDGDMFPLHCDGRYHKDPALFQGGKELGCISSKPCIHKTFEGMGIKMSLIAKAEGLLPQGIDTDPFPQEWDESLDPYPEGA